jgi:hypothetical protein
MSSWITFEHQGDSVSGRTRLYVVRAKGGEGLGEVRWFGRWSQYAFFPFGGTVFEQDCLRDIATFCEQRTKEHRQAVPGSPAQEGTHDD